jgi:hypothetical protein
MSKGRTAELNRETERSESEGTSRTLLPRGWYIRHGREASNVLAAIDYEFPKCDIISPSRDDHPQSCHLL